MNLYIERTLWFCLTCFCCVGGVKVADSHLRPQLEEALAHQHLTSPATQPPDYEAAFKNLMKEEGGYSEDPDDPGGATKYGISSRSYPHLDISSLTLASAKKIYHKDFWSPLFLQEFKAHTVACEVLEQAVNMGSKRAVVHLQTCAVAAGQHITIDGDLGKKTLHAVNMVNPDILVLCIKSQALGYYRDLSFRNTVFKKYLIGWFKRVLT